MPTPDNQRLTTQQLVARLDDVSNYNQQVAARKELLRRADAFVATGTGDHEAARLVGEYAYANQYGFGDHGMFNKNGIVLQRNGTMGFHYSSKAAIAGDTISMVNIGLDYERTGEGDAVANQENRKLTYERSGASNPVAYLIPKKHIAYAWHALAAAKGNPEAIAYAASLAAELTPAQRDAAASEASGFNRYLGPAYAKAGVSADILNPTPAEARKRAQYLLDAVKRNDPLTPRYAFMIATGYEAGAPGFIKDEKLAKGWMNFAASHGYPEAQLRMGRMQDFSREGSIESHKWFRIYEKNGGNAAEAKQALEAIGGTPDEKREGDKRVASYVQTHPLAIQGAHWQNPQQTTVDLAELTADAPIARRTPIIAPASMPVAAKPVAKAITQPAPQAPAKPAEKPQAAPASADTLSAAALKAALDRPKKEPIDATIATVPAPASPAAPAAPVDVTVPTKPAPTKPVVAKPSAASSPAAPVDVTAVTKPTAPKPAASAPVDVTAISKAAAPNTTTAAAPKPATPASGNIQITYGAAVDKLNRFALGTSIIPGKNNGKPVPNVLSDKSPPQLAKPIIWYQTILTNAGQDTCGIDGDFKTCTKAATIAIQRKFHLPETGKATRETVAALQVDEATGLAIEFAKDKFLGGDDKTRLSKELNDIVEMRAYLNDEARQQAANLLAMLQTDGVLQEQGIRDNDPIMSKSIGRLKAVTAGVVVK